MPVKGGVLTPQERALSTHYAATGDQGYAGQKAGYRGPSGASQALQRPAVQENIRRIQLARIENEILPLAIERHIALLKDKHCTGQVLNRAIEMAYKYGLADVAGGREKEAHEMTAEELAQAIGVLQRVASDKAKPIIEHEPPAPAPSVEPGVFA